jgi:tRNA pseudouridine38-40 synthase
MRVRGTLEYLGTKWSGWQLQPNAPTIQGELERALKIFTRRDVRVSAAGRTDAGVHASGQVISFVVDDDADLSRMRRSLNALTDPSLCIVDLVPAHPQFDPRRDAISRTYEYTIVNVRPPGPFLADRSWHVHMPLELDLLQRLAASIAGEHDFAAFRASDCASSSSRRHVRESFWRQDGAILTYRVTANAFLKQMVRTLVGSMVDVAFGRLEERRFAGLLDGGSREMAGETAPPQGLTLVHVEYPDEAAAAGWESQRR